MANYKDGIIRNGSSIGSGNSLCNIKDDIIRDGSYVSIGRTIGKIKDYPIKGMEQELDAEIVATYHFLIKKIV